MRILYRILAIVLALSVFGNLIVGNIFIVGIILTILFAYLGWKPQKTNATKDKLKSTSVILNNPDLAEFKNSFSEDQKAAMIYSLMLIVASEGNYDAQKFNYTSQQAELLSIDLEGKSMSVYQGKKADYAYSVIKTLSESQKDFYSVLLGNIILVNGKPTENELKLTNRILTETDISEEQFKSANMKAQALLNKFGH